MHHRTQLGPHFSEGARLLFLRVLKSSFRDVGQDLGVDHSVVYRWAYGDSLPSAKHLNSIATRYRVKAGAWSAAPKESFIPPAARATPHLAFRALHRLGAA